MPEVQLHLIGWDHHKSNLQDRERLAVAFGELPDFLNRLKQEPGIEEAVIVSTCNRSEWYVAADINQEQLFQAICAVVSVDPDDSDSSRAVYYKTGNEVVTHLFRVISSLESMVVGEYQIVHQVKQAYERAQQCYSVGVLLHPLFQKALSAGKDIRNNTAIGKYKVSVASIAVDLARQIFGDLSKSRLLIVGAGEMADLMLTHLLEQGVEKVSIINRRRERLEAFIAGHQRLQQSQIEVSVCAWEDLAEAISDHDIIMCSTSAPVPVITKERIIRNRRPHRLMFIDLAVPRDVASNVAELTNVYPYNLDHFEQVAAQNIELRSEDIEQAEALLGKLINEFTTETQQTDIYAEVAEFFDRMTENETTYALKHLAKRECVVPEKEMNYLISRVGKKIRHQMIQQLRDRPDDHKLREVISTLCGLDR